jgi:hypothetical protein
MDDRQFRDYLKKADDESREDRVRRRSELSVVTIVGKYPDLMWDYSCEVIQLYICGYFTSVILWCAGVLESVLADQLIVNGKAAKEVIELLSLDEKSRLCHGFEIITKQDKKSIDRIRVLRNDIIHANAGNLAKRAQTYYGDVDTPISKALPSLYLGNFDGSMKSQALNALKYTHELLSRWYGEKQPDGASGQG